MEVRRGCPPPACAARAARAERDERRRHAPPSLPRSRGAEHVVALARHGSRVPPTSAITPSLALSSYAYATTRRPTRAAAAVADALRQTAGVGERGGDCTDLAARGRRRGPTAPRLFKPLTVFVVQKTGAMSAVPIGVDGTADPRRLVAKAAIECAQAADMTAIGHTRKIVQYFHVATPVHRRNGGLPGVLVHVAS